MRLDRFDLNLLVAFEALFHERSVTRAAARLNVTQPAMSAALRRLRESFGDALFVANGKHMVPTTHALHLAPQISRMLAATRGLIAESTHFDPSTSQREFRIAASDYITTIVLRPLLQHVATIAPTVRFALSSLHTNVSTDLERGELDCIISPEQFQSQGHPQELLFMESHVLLGCRHNRLFSAPISKEAYDQAPHIVVQLANTLTYVEEQIRAMGDNRRIDITVATFTAVPWLLPDTDRIALVHRRLANFFMAHLPLAVAEPPFDIPPMREVIQYNRTRSDDSGLRWLVKMICDQENHITASGFQ